MATKADGPRIRRLREELGLNGVQLAAEIGISRFYLSRIERGQRQGSPGVRLRIAQALNVPVSHITLTDNRATRQTKAKAA